MKEFIMVIGGLLVLATVASIPICGIIAIMYAFKVFFL